ncbi:hypothetical protein LOB66_07985 [Lactobacillus delbrueckii subsp. lactis]|uniref:Rib/alpha-like domain-containing protein n=1 Tax=Lactobacillus delbrueckii TaxID=1584 RepID=UPI001E552901|nr:Rib/alpha-like domain-containing protein [Lactobacillus delbrueckii]MCD5446845.1 hypothetical protein [Lactobacillus delbrueckii subsp. lactis]MCD5487450.1 hypothetical protein [Lactobacillus delbrueckii subsp. lactis]MCD5494482.1 hypothetical protein [Lactobacillus delbrueckii subsp. lactis]MCD5529718.1 hypothetical protein [Lactobacillus delbrueckii subsp. lactis]MCS8607996.1 hypothetical protein [Lactobacillus delbrueckii subsp. lactis]
MKWGANLYYDPEVSLDWAYDPEKFLTNISSLPAECYFSYLDDFPQNVNTEKGGTYKARIQVEYPDGSKEVVGAITFVVPMMDADKVKVSLKSSHFTVSSNEALEHKTDNGDLTLNDPTRFLNIGSALPEGTVIRFRDDENEAYSPDPGEYDPGEYETLLAVYFPDGSYYYTDWLTVDVK